MTAAPFSGLILYYLYNLLPQQNKLLINGFVDMVVTAEPIVEFQPLPLECHSSALPVELHSCLKKGATLICFAVGVQIPQVTKNSSKYLLFLQENLRIKKARTTWDSRLSAYDIQSGRAFWWRRGELNPRPKALLQELLRAQTILYIPLPKRGSSHSWAW